MPILRLLPALRRLVQLPLQGGVGAIRDAMSGLDVWMRRCVMNPGQVIGLLWTIAAWWFIASLVIGPIVALIQKARARGQRLFVDEPTARVHQLRRAVGDDHYWD